MTEWDESSLGAALAEALEEKEKAAEYGLQLLHRNTHLEQCKQQLETKLTQLKSSHDDLKLSHSELSAANHRINKSLDQHDQSILSESEDREIGLMEERDHLRGQVKTMKKNEKRQKKKITELLGQVEYLTDDTEKYKMSQRTSTEQIRALRAKEKNFEKDYEDLVKEICELQKEIGLLRQNDTKAEGLMELNDTLRERCRSKEQELERVQQIYYTTEHEKREILAALEVEREAKEIYQYKLAKTQRSGSIDIPVKIMGSPNQIHSPPLSSVAQDLADELQESIQLSVTHLEEQLECVTGERSMLKDIVEQHKKELSQSQEMLVSRDAEMEDMKLTIEQSQRQLGQKEEIERRFYMLQESHQNLINDLSTDIIKLKQSNTALRTAEFLGHETIIHLKKDAEQMEARYFESNSTGLIGDMRKEIYILRDRERALLQTITNLKSDLSRDDDEKLTAMYIELHTLFTDICILKKFSSQDVDDGQNDWLVGQDISTDKVVALLKQQVSQLRSTINSILMSQVLSAGLNISEKELTKFKRILLSSRQSIVDVKSEYEGDLAVLRTSNTELRCRNKQLEREKLEWDSLRKVFDMKCEEYIVEVGIMEKRLRESDRERRTLQDFLQQIIVDKIELKQQIEEFEIALEDSIGR